MTGSVWVGMEQSTQAFPLLRFFSRYSLYLGSLRVGITPAHFVHCTSGETDANFKDLRHPFQSLVLHSSALLDYINKNKNQINT